MTSVLLKEEGRFLALIMLKERLSLCVTPRTVAASLNSMQLAQARLAVDRMSLVGRVRRREVYGQVKFSILAAHESNGLGCGFRFSAEPRRTVHVINALYLDVDLAITGRVTPDLEMPA